LILAKNEKQLREDQMNREGQKAAERDKALNGKLRQQVLSYYCIRPYATTA
jgi:hypothetical protein